MEVKEIFQEMLPLNGPCEPVIMTQEVVSQNACRSGGVLIKKCY